MPNFSKIRASATSVFESLKDSLHVSCVVSHKASIYLGFDAGHTHVPRDVASEATAHSFRVVLHHDVVNTEQIGLPWSLEEAEIKLIQATTKVTLRPQCTMQPPSLSASPRTTKSVGFQLPDTAASPPQSVPAPVEIQDLCVQLRNIRSINCGACLGYLTGRTDDDRHGIFWPDNRLIDTQSLSIDTGWRARTSISPGA
jgi:hypothetical protein